MSGARRNNPGFSLLELTTAIFLLTTCAFGMVQMFHVGVQSARTENERQIALRAIENELETLRATPTQQLALGDKLPFRSVTRELETLRLATPQVVISRDSELPLFHVRASVRWITQNGHATSAALEMLIAIEGDADGNRSANSPTPVIPAKAGTLDPRERPHQ